MSTIARDEIGRIDGEARKLVCGLRQVTTADGDRKWITNNRGFSHMFQDHPWCQAAMSEGWDIDLRTVLIRHVYRRMMNRMTCNDPDQLMPPKPLVDHWRARERKNQVSHTWRSEIIKRHGSVDAFLSKGKPAGKSPFRSLGASSSSRLDSERRLLEHRGAASGQDTPMPLPTYPPGTQLASEALISKICGETKKADS